MIYAQINSQLSWSRPSVREGVRLRVKLGQVAGLGVRGEGKSGGQVLGLGGDVGLDLALVPESAPGHNSARFRTVLAKAALSCEFWLYSLV